MRTISVTVSSEDYEAFREAARAEGRSIADLIREAMVYYRDERIARRSPLIELPVLAGHRATTKLPPRRKVYSEIFERRRT